MKQLVTENYIFNYDEGSPAERDIEEIAAYQEACFRYICSVLRTRPGFRIEYYLCESPEEVGRIYGDNEPCNGFNDGRRIFAVYNDKIRCTGFHEDAHVISYTLRRPECGAVREGLAMYFDRKWWGIHNADWTGWFLKTGRYVPFNELLDNERFYSLSDVITYPEAGAFTEWLISSFGIDRFLEAYVKADTKEAFSRSFGKTAEELDAGFREWTGLFDTDKEVENRMEALLPEAVSDVVF